jgi:ATP-dependent RNA helicase DDX47/RRP3
LQPQIEAILKVLSKQRQTWLFSATMTSNVSKLSRSSVKASAVRVAVSDKYGEGSFVIFIFV